MVRVARRWKFQSSPERVWKQGSAAMLSGASTKDLGHRLRGKGYQVRRVRMDGDDWPMVLLLI